MDGRNFLILSDLDGTIVPMGLPISVENIAAVTRMEGDGVVFSIATGRSPEAAMGYVKDLPVNGASLFFNGAMLYDCQREQVLGTTALTAENPRLWIQFAEKVETSIETTSVEIHTTRGCEIISEPKYDDPRLIKEFYHVLHTPLDELCNMKKTPWLKLLIYDTPEHLKEVEQMAADSGMLFYANMFYSEPTYLEFVAKNASKGYALQAIRKMPAYKGRTFLALGDYLNDLTMMKEADISIAPANAHDAVKRVADFVACDAREHLLVWVEQHFSEIVTRIKEKQAIH